MLGTLLLQQFDLSSCQVTPYFLKSADKSIPYGAIKLSSKVSVDIVCNSPLSIGFLWDASCAEPRSNLINYLSICLQILFIRASGACGFAWLKVVVIQYCSCRRLHLYCRPSWYHMTDIICALPKHCVDIEHATPLAYLRSVATSDHLSLAHA